tara:strand:- start:1322 stop:3211 length:1890 start_codon:yes stop_codon:yes gene_type:complete
MPATQYLNLDFDQVKDQIKSYLRANSNFTDYDFEGSNLSILIDILAYNSFINSYNTNMVANEAFLETASLRENVITHAENIGYVPRSSRGSRAKISFNIVFSNDTTTSFLTLKKGPVAVSNIINSNYPFSIAEDVTVPVKNLIASFSELEIIEGSVVDQTFTVNSALSNQRFYLNNPKIDTTTIKVRIKESATSQIYTDFRLVENIIGESSSEPIFIIKESKDETYELIFGDGFIGKRLENGNVVEVSYVVCNEDETNGFQNFTFNGRLVDSNLNPILPTGINLTVNQASIGGSKLESIKSIKNYASRYLATQNRAVTTTDYETLIPKLFSKAESAVAYGGETLTPPQYGKVYVSIKPDNSSFLSLFDKTFIKNELKKYSPVGIDVVIEDLKYLYVELDVNAYFSTNLTSSSSNIRSKIFTTMSAFSDNADLTRFGGRFKYSNFVGVIDDTDVAITSNVTNVILRRDLIPEFNSFFSYELCYGNSLFAPLNSSYNIKSTGFTIDKYTDTVYLTDFATSSTTGRLLLFKINKNGAPEVLENNVGTVDYTTGELLIDSLNITSTTLSNGAIEVECLPQSYDLIGLRDLFLSLAVSKSTVTMIKDDISSGSDTSGVNFISTPQYNKSGFFRV